MSIRALGALAVWVVWSSACGAALIVDPARPITHQVSIQIIETALSDGTSAATIFGNAQQRSAIEAGIDQVWGQAGIDIAFLPNILRYNNTFAYQGSGGSRPTSDLNTIISGATSAGKVNVDPSVINMFFVNVVPGFAFTSEYHANGLANIGHDGIAQFVGDSLLTFASGLDVIAEVVSHEIGHNLGLKHTASGLANLMSSNGSTAQLSAEQIDAIFQTTGRNDSVAFIPSGGTGFVRPFSLPLTGDFNDDGLVNAVDIDRLALAAHSEPNNLLYDLNDDGTVTFVIGPRGSPTPSDSDVLIRDILHTEYGDLDLNGEVFLSDLTALATNYRQPGQFGWAGGNINGSQDVGTTSQPRVFLSDLTALATNWRFGVGESGAGSGFATIPEPSGWLMVVCGIFFRLAHRARGSSQACAIAFLSNNLAR
jgi:hypothetical protein